VVDTADSPITL